VTLPSLYPSGLKILSLTADRHAREEAVRLKICVPVSNTSPKRQLRFLSLRHLIATADRAKNPPLAPEAFFASQTFLEITGGGYPRRNAKRKRLPTTGIEPMTSSLLVMRSTSELRGLLKDNHRIKNYKPIA
jgi:hypothetical protein